MAGGVISPLCDITWDLIPKPTHIKRMDLWLASLLQTALHTTVVELRCPLVDTQKATTAEKKILKG